VSILNDQSTIEPLGISETIVDKSELVLPKLLKQYYVTCPLDKKIDYLAHFLRMNSKSKVLIFVSSCKQVRYIYEAFCKLQPGIPLLSLHGRQKQLTRMNTYYSFCRKQNAALISTDVASRGLDFPTVDWVIHLDKPESIETYVHRSGRTARYNASGTSLLILSPNEADFLTLTKDRQFELQPFSKIDTHRLPSAKMKLQLVCSKHADIKYLAQRSFVSYLRSLYLQCGVSIDTIKSLPLKEFSESLGLINVPRVRFLGSSSDTKNASREMGIEDEDSD
jgi:ATP-dependent RNA helicase DDX10/DBP4